MERKLQCPRTVWCDQDGATLHRCQATLGTWPGIAVTGETRGMTTQLVIDGGLDHPKPVLVLVSSLSLQQWDCRLDWDQAIELAAQIELAAGRFRA